MDMLGRWARFHTINDLTEIKNVIQLSKSVSFSSQTVCIARVSHVKLYFYHKDRKNAIWKKVSGRAEN